MKPDPQAAEAVAVEILAELHGDIELRQYMAKERDDAQTIMDECSKRIGSVLALMGGKYLHPQWDAQLVVGERSTLDPKKLLEAGVPMETITKCTVKSSYTQVRVIARSKAKSGAGTAA